MSAATAARRRQPDAEIVVIERGPRVSFMLCGLPYFISDVVKDEESLVVYERRTTSAPSARSTSAPAAK